MLVYWIVYLNRFNRFECVSQETTIEKAKETCDRYNKFHPETEYSVVKAEFVTREQMETV
jgi:hypothetical protein